jgi:TolB-like protein/Tfp pilus assembly protein PilF
MSDGSFFAELKKRRVIQVAAIYGAVAWGVTEILVTIVEQLFLPAWVSTLAVIAFVVGFPITMFLAWTFDITPEGIQRTTISSRKGKASIAGAMVLLLACTAGLFLLIRPDFRAEQDASRPIEALPNSIAVLPFDNVSRDPDDAYLSAGFSDELRDQLGRVSGLRIAARSSSVVVRDQAVDARTMSEILGVAALVEGSVRRSSNSLRISVQLIDGRTGIAIWSDSYDRRPQEFLTVQQIIAEEIVKNILPEQREVVARTATRSASANELMLLARFYEQSVRDQPDVDVETLLEAISLYRQATNLDPQSALAHSRLASALLYLGDLSGAEAPIFKALSLDPDLSEVQVTLGQYYWKRGLRGARGAWERAIELNPNNADALAAYASHVWMQGYNEQPEVLYRRALELDPLSLSRLGDLGHFLAQDGRVEETMQIVRRVEELKELFDDVASRYLVIRLLELTGQLDESIALAITLRDSQPENPAHVWLLAELYAEIGDFDTALKLDPEGVGVLFKMGNYEELVDIAELLMIDEPQDRYLRYLLAFAYNATENFEGAIRILESTGLPGTVIPESTEAMDIEGLVYLASALERAGNIALAREYAGWLDARHHVDNENWWVHTYRDFERVASDRAA